MSSWTVWTGKKSFDWNDAENWSNGVPERGKHALIPAAPTGGDFPKVASDLTIHFTLKNNGVLDNEGSIIIDQEGIIQNDGQFINRQKACIVNRGIVVNNGVFTDNGAFDNQKILLDKNGLPTSFPDTFQAFFSDQQVPRTTLIH